MSWTCVGGWSSFGGCGTHDACGDTGRRASARLAYLMGTAARPSVCACQHDSTVGVLREGGVCTVRAMAVCRIVDVRYGKAYVTYVTAVDGTWLVAEVMRTVSVSRSAPASADDHAGVLDRHALLESHARLLDRLRSTADRLRLPCCADPHEQLGYLRAVMSENPQNTPEERICELTAARLHTTAVWRQSVGIDALMADPAWRAEECNYRRLLLYDYLGHGRCGRPVLVERVGAWDVAAVVSAAEGDFDKFSKLHCMACETLKRMPRPTDCRDPRGQSTCQPRAHAHDDRRPLPLPSSDPSCLRRSRVPQSSSSIALASACATCRTASDSHELSSAWPASCRPTTQTGSRASLLSTVQLPSPRSPSLSAHSSPRQRWRRCT